MTFDSIKIKGKFSFSEQFPYAKLKALAKHFSVKEKYSINLLN